MQNSTLLIVILIALGVLGVGWFLFMNEPATPAPVGQIEEYMDEAETGATTEEESPPSSPSAQTGAGVDIAVGAGVDVNAVPMTATVMYSSSGYSPSSVKIKKGGTVTWIDQGTGRMWTATASHPTHTGYSGTTLQEHCGGSVAPSFDQCENSSRYSFTFDKVGTWRYHNHSQSSHFGSVEVVE